MFRFTIAAVAVAISLNAPAVKAALITDTVGATNTFQSGTVGVTDETFFEGGTSTIVDPGLEFGNFATIFDIDFNDDELTMTFANADPGSLFVNQYGPTDFDRYYFGFDSNVVNTATLVSNAADAPGLTSGLTIGAIAPGFVLNLPTFGPDAFTREFVNGGFVVEFGDGTDYLNSSLTDSITIGLSTTAVPEPTSTALLFGIGGLAALRRRSKLRSKVTNPEPAA